MSDATTPSTATGRLPDFDALWDYVDPAGTEAKFRAVLSETSATAPAAYALQLRTQIARCQGLRGKFADAHATLDDVERALASHDDALTRVRYLLERGRVLNSGGDPTSARPLFVKAYELGRATGVAVNRFTVDAAHMVAIVEPATDDQIKWNLIALELANADPAQSRWLRAIYNNLGEAYRSAGRYEDSLECFQSLVKWYEDRGQPVDRYARIDEAKLLRLCGRHGESLRKIEALAAELQAAHEQDGFVEEELAESLLANGREADARAAFRRAWQTLKSEAWIEKSEPQRWARLKQMTGE